MSDQFPPSGNDNNDQNLPGNQQPPQFDQDPQAQQYGQPSHDGQAPQYQQPYGQQPYAAAGYAPAGTPVSAPKGLAIAALVCGIVSLLIALLPIIGIPAGIAAIVLGVIALNKKQSKGMSLTGLILGIIGIVMSIGWLIMQAVFLSAATTALSSAAGDLASYSQDFESYASDLDELAESYNAADGTAHTADMQVSVSAGEAEVSYVVGTETQTITVGTDGFSQSVDFTGINVVSITAVGDFTMDSQELSCTVTIDGTVVDEQSGTGLVSCLGDTMP